MTSPWQRTIWRAENMGRRLQGFRSVRWVVIVFPAQLAVAAFEAIPRHYGETGKTWIQCSLRHNLHAICVSVSLVCLLTLFTSVKTHLRWVGFFFFFSGWFKPSYWLSSGCEWSLCTSEPWGRKCGEVIVGREQQHLREKPLWPCQWDAAAETTKSFRMSLKIHTKKILDVELCKKKKITFLILWIFFFFFTLAPGVSECERSESSRGDSGFAAIVTCSYLRHRNFRSKQLSLCIC